MNNTVQAMNGVATEREQHYSWCSAVIINSCLMRPDKDATKKKQLY